MKCWKIRENKIILNNCNLIPGRKYLSLVKVLKLSDSRNQGCRSLLKVLAKGISVQTFQQGLSLWHLLQEASPHRRVVLETQWKAPNEITEVRTIEELGSMDTDIGHGSNFMGFWFNYQWKQLPMMVHQEKICNHHHLISIISEYNSF